MFGPQTCHECPSFYAFSPSPTDNCHLQTLALSSNNKVNNNRLINNKKFVKNYTVIGYYMSLFLILIK